MPVNKAGCWLISIINWLENIRLLRLYMLLDHDLAGDTIRIPTMTQSLKLSASWIKGCHGGRITKNNKTEKTNTRELKDMPAINNIKRFLRPAFSHFISFVSPVRQSIVKALHASGKQFCPVCKSNLRQFLPAGNPPRAHARCPVCGSLERHRLDWIFFSKQTSLGDGSPKKMLHVAPEVFLSSQFRKIKNLEYLSADINNPGAMVQMDITDIHYPDNSFSVIYCSHVLEHIPNDCKALAELYRVLCPDGWALLQVPVTAEKTYEDPAIVEPEERLKHFGQSDHVRRCGADYVERIRSAGFVVTVLRGIDLATGADCEKMGFQPDRLIFFCVKPAFA